MYEIIPGRLATHGLFGAAPDIIDKHEGWGPEDKTGEVETINGKEWTIVDARILSDEGPNVHTRYPLLHNYLRAQALLILAPEDGRVLVVCDAGESRSNSVAIAILIDYFNMEFYSAWDLVRDRVPICHIDSSHIYFLKRLYNVTLP